jgi:hypothetical protein
MIKFRELMLLLQKDVGPDVIVSCQADPDGMKFIFRWMDGSGWVKDFTIRIALVLFEEEDVELVHSAIRSYYPRYDLPKME